MCLDIHPKQSSLVVVGLYDGSVAVFDMSRKANRESALVRSTAKTGKHTDPVWGIKWHSDDVDQNRNFSSVSSDGRVSTWTMVQTELQHTDIIRLSYDTSKRPLTVCTFFFLCCQFILIQRGQRGQMSIIVNFFVKLYWCHDEIQKQKQRKGLALTQI